MGEPKNKGQAKQVQKQSKKMVGYDPKKMNKGGFYAGMRGVTLDEHGNRKMISFVVEPEGYGNAQIFCHPKLAKACIQDVMQYNPMIKAVNEAAVIDLIFEKKNPLNWPLRMRYRIYVWWENRKYQKKVKEAQKKEDAETKEHLKVVN